MLACNCDYRISFDNIKFHMVETAIGLTIQPSTYECIHRIIGNHHMTSWFLQTALPVKGQKAMDIHMCDRFVTPRGDEDKLMETAINVMEKEYFNADIKCAASPKGHARKRILELLRKEQNPSFGSKDSKQYMGLKGMKKQKQSKL